MAELKNDEEEHTFPSKRKPIDTTATADDSTDDLQKKQKLASQNPHPEPTTDVKTANENAVEEDDEEDEEEEDYEGDGESDSDDDENEEEEAEPEIDRKGKGIMKDIKGKGKLVEEEEEESDDDSSNVVSDDDDDSDLSDDPLAEVDLDNILPSRTRRGVARRGLNISSDVGKDK